MLKNKIIKTVSGNQLKTEIPNYELDLKLTYTLRIFLTLMMPFRSTMFAAFIDQVRQADTLSKLTIDWFYRSFWS